MLFNIFVSFYTCYYIFFFFFIWFLLLLRELEEKDEEWILQQEEMNEYGDAFDDESDINFQLLGLKPRFTSSLYSSDNSSTPTPSSPRRRISYSSGANGPSLVGGGREGPGSSRDGRETAGVRVLVVIDRNVVIMIGILLFFFFFFFFLNIPFVCFFVFLFF
jgi:hypothetical protein